MTLRISTCILCMGLALAACSRSDPDDTPDGAVRLWLEKMEDAENDPRMMRELYTLIGPEARANLEERARRTGQLQGRRVEPHEMLAEGLFGLRFRPRTMRTNVSGERATVEILGGDPALERTLVRCVRERGGWRVEPELPLPSALSSRDGGQ